MFADDTNIFIHGKNKALVVKQANQCISDLNCWFTANKLSINFDKTCYTVFGIGRTDKDIKINLAGTEIKRVLIDEELKWVENIDYIYNKVVKYIGIFYKLQNNLSATVLNYLFCICASSYSVRNRDVRKCEYKRT